MISNPRPRLSKASHLATFLLLLSVSLSSYAENCSQQRQQQLTRQLNLFFKNYHAKHIKAHTVHYNCKSPSETNPTWEDNVALVYPQTINKLPFYDNKSNCRYWSHNGEGHIRCAVKKAPKHH